MLFPEETISPTLSIPWCPIVLCVETLQAFPFLVIMSICIFLIHLIFRLLGWYDFMGADGIDTLMVKNSPVNVLKTYTT